MLTHVVLLRLRDPGEAAEARARLVVLSGRVPALRSLRCVLDTVGRDGSFDLALTTTHDDVDGLLAYLQHPEHAAFSEWLAPRVEARAVVDTVE